MPRVINVRVGTATRLLLGALPLLALLVLYMHGSAQRLAENPKDKLLPAPSTLVDSAVRLATETDRRSGRILLWADTRSSLGRLGLGVGCAASLALVLGIGIGVVPLMHSTLSPLVSVLSMIPPLAILPILFIVFGLGEVAKVTLIVIGVGPLMVRELALRVTELPEEQIVKAQTLGASSLQLILRVVLPQTLPRLIDAIRLALGPAWLFLIAAEAIAATEGLGYRIFLVRRYLAMDVILPYVLWITLLAFCVDLLLKLLNRRLFPWFRPEREA